MAFLPIRARLESYLYSSRNMRNTSVRLGEQEIFAGTRAASKCSIAITDRLLSLFIADVQFARDTIRVFNDEKKRENRKL